MIISVTCTLYVLIGAEKWSLSEFCIEVNHEETGHGAILQ